MKKIQLSSKIYYLRVFEIGLVGCLNRNDKNIVLNGQIRFSCDDIKSFSA